MILIKYTGTFYDFLEILKRMLQYLKTYCIHISCILTVNPAHCCNNKGGVNIFLVSFLCLYCLDDIQVNSFHDSNAFSQEQTSSLMWKNLNLWLQESRSLKKPIIQFFYVFIIYYSNWNPYYYNRGISCRLRLTSSECI